jgi:uncharacterized protein with HEPN domain
MTEDDAAVLLEQMLDAAQCAVSYVEGFSKADFLDDRRTREAVALNLMVIGELATRLSKSFGEFASANPSLQLREMQGMRNRIAHGYVKINMVTVWETVETSLPELIKTLPSIIQSARGPQTPSSSGDR